MSVIFEEGLAKEITSGHLAPVYCLYGEDSYLKRHYSGLLCQAACEGDPFFNLQKFDGSVDLQQVYDAVNQLPVLADKKCVFLTDYDFEHADKTDFTKLCELISMSGDGCTLVLLFDCLALDLKKSSKVKKLLSAVEQVGGRAVCLDHRKPEGLVKLLLTGSANRGCQMDRATARYMIETVGDDIDRLKSELDKLCAFCGAGRSIDRKTVDLVCIKTVEASVYEYVKQIFNADLTKAIRMLDDLFFLRMEPMAILYTTAAAYVDVYRVMAGAKSRVPIRDIAKDFGYKNRSFVLDRAAVYAKKLDQKTLSLSLAAILEADQSLKSLSGQDRTVLEKLTVKLVYIIVKGESVD